MRSLTVTLLTAFGLQAAGQTAPDPRSLSRSEPNPPAQLRAAAASSSRFGSLLGAVDTARSPDRPFAKTSCGPRFTRPVAGVDPYGDSDGDGVNDGEDWCLDTPPRFVCDYPDTWDPELAECDPDVPDCEEDIVCYEVDAEDGLNDYGCLLSEMDEDNDCVNSLLDSCPQTKWGNRGVDDSGCPGSNSWTLSGVAEGYEPGDLFGQTVAVSADGRTVAVGAPGHAWLGVQGSGQVVIFTDEGDFWSSEELGDPDFISFGRTLAMSGDGSKLAVAQNASRDADGNGILSTVQVYERSGSSWVQLGDDIALGADVNDDRDSFGAALAMDHSGETLAVGVPGSDGSDGGTGNNDQRGEVRVYRLLGNAWGQLGEGIQGREEYERSGISVALSSDGKVIAIGTESGRARTYYREGADWKSRGGDVTGANMVANVALSGGGDTLAVTFWDYDGVVGVGIQTFHWQGAWNASQGPAIRLESAVAEARVALSSDGTLLLGSQSNYDKDGTARVRLYRKGPVAEDWQFQGPFVEGWYQVHADLERGPVDTLRAIALSGDGKTVVIGTPDYDGDPGNEGTDRGRAAVYRLP